MGQLYLFVVIVFALGPAQAVYQGCYSESVRRRHFLVNPGDYSPELMTVQACMASCGSFDYPYAAISSGKFCFCSSTLPSAGPVADSLCDVPCVGNTQQKCGASKYVSVHTASKRVTGLTISTDANSVIPVATPVNIDVSVSSGLEVVYSFDYDDGAGRTGPNVTDMRTRTYYIPGEYSVRVYANDVNQTFQDQAAATTVRVDSPPGEVTVECDPIFATFEQGKCTCTVWSGSSMNLDVTVHSFSYSLAIEDPPLSLAGPAISTKTYLAGDSTNAIYVMQASEFSVSGKILGWEMIAQTTGTVQVLVLKPTCSSYCYSSNTCASPCKSQTSRVTSCATNEQFCAQFAKCAATCNAQPSRYSTNPTSYEVTYVGSVTVSQTGYRYVAATGTIQVEPGYVLGIAKSSGNAVLNRLSSTSGLHDTQFPAATVSAGQSFTLSSGSSSNARHALRAVASAGAKVHLPFEFETAGNFTLTAIASSATINAPVKQATTTVVVLEGVNATIISGPTHAKTGVPVSFVVQPHTGNNVYYNWTITDGTEALKTTQRNYTHNFVAKGVYNISAVVYNVISNKENFTEVIIQDAVTALSLTTTPTVHGQATNLEIKMTSGSDYICTWSYGDGSPTEQTDEVTTPVSGATRQHTYATAGTYTASVTCANDVSSATKNVTVHVQETITNLRMIAEGANKNVAFYLEWAVDKGTGITFTVIFGGIPITSHTSVSKYRWKSNQQPGRGASIIPLTINATNLVSNAIISVNFQILTAIVNPTFTVPSTNASSHETITFTANMDAGSDVTLTVDFDDSSPLATYNQPPGVDWAGPQTFTHSYSNGGRFTVKATFSNAQGTYERSVEMVILVGVGIIDCETVTYALYHPPAYVNLTLVASSLPTDPTLTLNWGEPQSTDTKTDLVLNTPYKHEYGDTGTFIIKAKISNLLGNKTCQQPVTIVEKLEKPHFKQKFSKAAVGLPYEVNFCLYRGPSGSLCNLTFNFGDGSGSQVYQRQGQGKDGCDTKLVTYSDMTPKTITVDAVTPLESASKQLTVEIIKGVEDSKVVVSTNGDVTLGSQSAFTLVYNGATMPDNAQVSFVFGDGSSSNTGPFAFAITSQGGSQTFTHTFTKDGLHNTKVTIQNDATSVEKTVQVGVYKNFANLRADIYYLADIPPNAVTYGIGNSYTMFPQNKAIYFRVVDDNNAYASTYVLTATRTTTGNIVSCTHTTSEFSIMLNETGDYNIAITASNALHSASIAPKTITMFEMVEGFSMVEAKTKVGMNEVKAFNISFIKTGTKTCLYVNFGDGMKKIYSDHLSQCTLASFSTVPAANKFPLSGLTQIDHTYATEGYYSVSATAKNQHSQETVDLSFSISGLDCSKPSVDIANRRNHFTNPTEYVRSDKVRVRGLSNIQCANSYDNAKSWKIESINDQYDTVIAPISMAGVNTTKAELNLEPRFLDLGLYKVHYTMTMAGNYGANKFESTTYTYIRIKASDLVGIMVPGGASEIERGTSQSLTLSPLANSYDPDVASGAAQGLTVASWSCTLKAETTPAPECQNAGFDSSANPPASQSLNIANLQLGKTYRIGATLTKDTRSTLTELDIKVVAGAPPTIAIRPSSGTVFYQMSDGFKVLKSSRLSLGCVCDDCSPTDVIGYEWLVFLQDYRWPEGWRPLAIDTLGDLVVGSKSREISIQASLFETFQTNRMRVECKLIKGGVTSKVATNLNVNTPPTPGTCTVSPLNRTITTETAWTITVNGWSDDDGIDRYQFFTTKESSTTDTQISSIQTSNSLFTVKVSLSEGQHYKNYEQEVIVKVRDSLGAITDFSCGKVVVRPMAVEEMRSLAKNIKTNQLHEMKRLFAEGDQETCTERSTNILSVLNSDSKHSRSEYSGYNVASNYAGSMFGETDRDRPSFQSQNATVQKPEVAYKMANERNDRASVRTSLIQGMTQLETKTVVSMQQVTSCLAVAVRASDEINGDSQLTVMDYLDKMTSHLADPINTDKIPSEDLNTVLENSVAVIGGIMDAAGLNGFFGTEDELKVAAKNDKFFKYDTSIGAEDDCDTDAAKTFEEAMEARKKCIHKKIQKDKADQVREKVASNMNKLATIFSNNGIKGETMDIKTERMLTKMAKTDEQNLKGTEITAPGSIGGVKLPNTTFLTGVDADSPIVVSVSQSINHPLRYSEIAKGISSATNFMSINFYDGNNTKMSIKNLPEPVKVIIPRDTHMEKPAYIAVNPMISSWSTLMNIVLDINRTQSSVHLDFKDMAGRQFLLVVSKGKLANIAANSTDDSCNYVYLLPATSNGDPADQSRYRFHMDNKVLGDFTGQLAIGIRELNATEYDMDLSEGCASLPRYTNGSDYFKGNFSLRQYVTQCLAISDSEDDWSTGGVWVGKDTDDTATVCYSTHLTTFAGGWVVVPNTIDWSYVFANADFLKNPTIYITVIVTAVVYIAAAIYARWKDKKMAEQLGIAPLADNDPKDKYFYEVLVSTGMRRGAGTDSQVCFILSGEDDETDVRAFTDSKRKIFRRGQVDGFLMAVPRPLGHLNFMRVWHDNSGKGRFGSWYLNYITVRDVQTDTKQVFIANRWFAVEEDDGQVDRVLPVAGREQLADFSYQFGERSRKNLADGHLWFSVVARPPQSRFTCLQRVSCCLCLLYVTMLANAMFYNTTSKDETASNSFSFGPFAVSPEQIFIGVVSNLIVFPVNFLLIFLFRKSRPHHKRPSRIDRAIKEVYDHTKQASPNDVKPEVSSIFSVAKSPTIPKDPHRPDTSVSRPGTAMTVDSSTELTPTKKKKKFELPWYFTIISWILLWVVTLGAVTMVIFYGISFKDETCRKWISSMLVSFFMSVFITQPIKVFLFAIFLSLVIKNPGEDKEDEEEDEETPQVDPDSELLHGDINAYGVTRPKKIGYKPPDPAELEKHRQRRLKEIQMWEIIREVIIYSFFLWILMVISYRQLGASNFLFKDTMVRVFIEDRETDIHFKEIHNAQDFWSWTKSGLIQGIRAGAYYNDYPPLMLRAFVNDKVSRILGYAVMRQLRIKPGLCEIPSPMDGVISQCNVKYDMFNQEEATFKVGWQPMGPTDTENDTLPEYIYSTAKSLNGYPYWGTLAIYSGGGYVVDLIGSKENLSAIMEKLEKDNWIDRYTRAVFVEFTVYNPQVNLFAIGTILTEFHPSGGAVTSFRFEPAMLLPYMTSAMLFQLVCEIVYVLFTLFFIFREARSLIKNKINYFKSFWNLVEVGIIAMSIAAIVIFFYRLFVTNDLTKAFKESNGDGYVKFQYVAYWNETFSYMIGFLVFFATIKFLKLLRFNRKVSMLSATLRHSAKGLLHFSIIFVIIFMAFAQLFYLTFMHIDIEYSTFISSVVASILMMMGKFNIYSMIMVEPVLTQVFVLLFVITVTFIVVNMFISILNETFSAVREDVNKQGNDYEIVDFMMQRFKKWTGIGANSATDQQPPGGPDDLNNRQDLQASGGNETDRVEDFPDRIEKLLQSISSVYMDSDNLAQLYQKQPYSSQSGFNKNLMRTGPSPSPAPLNTRRRKDSSDVVARVHTD